MLTTFFERNGDALLILFWVLLGIGFGVLHGDWQASAFLGVAIVHLMKRHGARIKALEAENALLRGNGQR